MAISTDWHALERAPTSRRRVLVLFGNIPLLGQERGNIQVFYALREREIDALLVTNRTWGHLHVQPLLESLGLKWTVAPFLGKLRKGMGIREWAVNIGQIAKASTVLLRLLRRYKPTHIHVFNIDHFINFLPALLLTRIPIVYRLGDTPSDHRKAYRILWSYIIIPRVSTFVCVSQYVKSSLRQLGAPETKCKVIYSEPPVRVQSKVLDRKDKIVKGGAFTIVYVGQLTQSKGIDILVDVAIQMCRSTGELEVLIAGDFEWENELANGLRKSVEAADLSNRIRFLGYVDDIRHLFRLADLHVLPSVCADALPNVVIEAKDSGVPSVVFPTGGLPELIVHEVDGFVCADRTRESLIRGISYYMDSPRRACKHGLNAKSSLKGLSINQFGKLWNEVFDGN